MKRNQQRPVSSLRARRAAQIISAWLALVAAARGQVDNPAATGEVPAVEVPTAELNAERVAALTAAIDDADTDRGTLVKLLGQRAKEYARAGDWKRASADYQQVIDNNPQDTIAWLKRGVTLLLADDQMKHDDFARRMLEAFKQTKNTNDAERVAKMIWLSPTPGVARAEIDALSDFAYRSKEGRWGQYYPSAKALGHVRYGEFDQALAEVDESDRLNAATGAPQLDLVAINQTLRAICLAQLDKRADAVRELTAAGEKIQAGMKSADLLLESGFSHDWMIAVMLHREGRALLVDKARLHDR